MPATVGESYTIKTCVSLAPSGQETAVPAQRESKTVNCIETCLSVASGLSAYDRGHAHGATAPQASNAAATTAAATGRDAAGKTATIVWVQADPL